MGIGFAGGMWRGHEFAYNTAVMHVDGRYMHSTYVDRERSWSDSRCPRQPCRLQRRAWRHPPRAQSRGADCRARSAQAATSRRSTSPLSGLTGGAYVQEQRRAPAEPGRSPTAGRTKRRRWPGESGRGGEINYNASKSNTGNVTAHANAQGANAGTSQGRRRKQHYQTLERAAQYARRPTPHRTRAQPRSGRHPAPASIPPPAARTSTSTSSTSCE